jgi:hypothetical protein
LLHLAAVRAMSHDHSPMVALERSRARTRPRSPRPAWPTNLQQTAGAPRPPARAAARRGEPPAAPHDLATCRLRPSPPDPVHAQHAPQPANTLPRQQDARPAAQAGGGGGGSSSGGISSGGSSSSGGCAFLRVRQGVHAGPPPARARGAALSPWLQTIYSPHYCKPASLSHPLLARCPTALSAAAEAGAAAATCSLPSRGDRGV